MPTFTTIALESLLEPKIRDSYKTSTKSVRDFSSNDKKKKELEEEEQQLKLKKKAPVRNRVNISPALYITPEPTPILHSEVDSLSPSPYVVNRKGRGGKSVNRRVDGFEVEEGKKRDGEEERDLNGGGGKSRRGELQFEEVVDDNLVTEEIVGDSFEDFVAEDDFLDTRCDSLSVGSSGEVNDFGTRIESVSVVSNQGEFFDADDG